MNLLRRSLLALALAAPLLAHAQAVPKAPLVGYLTPGSAQRTEVKTFVEAMRALGYVDGNNIRYDFRGADGDNSRLDALAREIMLSRPAVVVAGGAVPVRALRETSASIPIVASSTVDPVLLGFAASLSRPGGNVTGTANMNDELLAKQFQLLGQLLPGARRVALLVNPANPVTGTLRTRAVDAGKALGQSVRVYEASDKQSLAVAFGAVAKERPDGLVVATDAALYALSLTIAGEVARIRLPAVYPAGERWVSEGGLVSYGPSFHEIYRRAASYVDKILKGAMPGDLPMEQPTTFELAVNLKTAKAQGLTIPRTVLLRADRVVE